MRLSYYKYINFTEIEVEQFNKHRTDHGNILKNSDFQII